MAREIVNHDVVLNFDIAGLPYILQKNYIGNHSEEFKEMMQYASRQDVMDELSEIKRQLKQPVVAIQRYAKTKHAAAYLDVDPSFLDKKRRAGVFEQGIHYHKPDGCSLVFWDLDALEKWITTVGVDNDNSEIIDNMFT